MSSARGRSFLFFATQNDLLPILRSIESRCDLKYVQAGLFPNGAPPTYISAFDIPHIGVSKEDSSEHTIAFLVLPKDVELAQRAIHGHDGVIRVAIDQLVNPHSIRFAPGGAYDTACLMKGYVDTCSPDPGSVALFQLFSRNFRKGLKRYEGEWIGSEALSLLQRGFRLVDNS